MTRFREEVYEAKWYKALEKKARSAEFLSKSEDPRSSEVRIEYFAKSHKGYRKRTEESKKAASIRMF